jgi:plasmid replication initiation protein
LDIKEIEQHYTITQLNNFMEASYDGWTVNEIKFLNIALSTIQKEDKELKTQYIKVTNIARLLKIKKLDYSILEKFCIELHKKQIKVKFFDENTKKSSFELYHWFSTFAYSNGVIKFKFDKSIEPFLLSLKDKLSIYRLENILPLKSKYSIQIYMFLKRMVKIGYRKISVDNFCEILNIDKDSTNHTNKYLKARVLEPAVKELIRKTDITFDYRIKKTKDSKIANMLLFKIYSDNSYDTFMTDAQYMTGSRMVKDYKEQCKIMSDDWDKL